mmetsp:Transcript_3055/g.5378  ORF Transcript_3055/g.5378 Transcript_3055/m.5378 type:complete len:210 (-) Transcript_3055:198-827(-)
MARIHSPKACRDLWTTHDLDRDVGCQRPEVCVRDQAWHVLGGNGLEELNRHLRQSSIRRQAMFPAARQAHCSIWAPIYAVENAGIMPGETNHDGAAILGRDQFLQVSYQVVVVQASTQGELQLRVALALVKHLRDITGDTVHLHDAISFLNLQVLVVDVPFLRHPSGDSHDRKDQSLCHVINIQAKLQAICLDELDAIQPLLVRAAARH